ncbi:MAG: flavodoxin family protein [Deltaproteobacteria bacterium]|jgi:flavodoxin|nr:flavodoxin family protein [Deltaproteobacteria bacterium]
MKTLTVYSSLTGNTQKVAEAVHGIMPPGSQLASVKDDPDPQGYDLVVVGFWVDKGQPDAAALRFLNQLSRRRTAFFFTLGACPESEHAQEAADETAKILEQGGNQVLGHFRCQGKVDPALLEKMKKMLPPDNPHAQMTPERQARLEEAAKHPNEADLEKAKIFAAEILQKAS